MESLFDMQKEVQKGHALESYKLDNVSSHFMKGKVKVKNHGISLLMERNYLFMILKLKI